MYTLVCKLLAKIQVCSWGLPSTRHREGQEKRLFARKNKETLSVEFKPKHHFQPAVHKGQWSLISQCRPQLYSVFLIKKLTTRADLKRYNCKSLSVRKNLNFRRKKNTIHVTENLYHNQVSPDFCYVAGLCLPWALGPCLMSGERHLGEKITNKELLYETSVLSWVVNIF